MFAIAVLRMHAGHQRAWAVERDQCDEILEAVRLEQFDQLLETRRFTLENAKRAAGTEHGEGLGISERHAVVINGEAFAFFDDVGGLLQNRHGFEAKEVHLQQTAFFDLRHVELSRGLVFDLAHRHVIADRSRCDDHAAGVDAERAAEFFQLQRRIEHLARALVGFVTLQHPVDGAELLLVFVERFAPEADLKIVFPRGILRHQVGEFLRFFRRPVVGARDVLDRHARFHGAERHDLRHRLVTVLVRHVVDDFAAPIFAEVDIDIGHRLAPRIHKAFEQQTVAQRAHVGDAHAVRHDRSGGRATAGADGNAAVFGPVDEVGNDQEVRGEAHLENGL